MDSVGYKKWDGFDRARPRSFLNVETTENGGGYGDGKGGNDYGCDGSGAGSGYGSGESVGRGDGYGEGDGAGWEDGSWTDFNFEED